MHPTPACEFATETAELCEMREPTPPLLRNKKPLWTILAHKVRNRYLAWLLRRRGVVWIGVAPTTTGRLPSITRSAPSRISIGSGCMFGDRAVIDASLGGTVVIGSHVFVNTRRGGICASECITIGDNSMIADEVVIMDDSFHAVSPDRPAKRAPVHIGRNVWINPGVRIGPGVTIGDHAVIGAKSVVTHDIPRKCFAAGAPARVIYAFECPDDWVRE